MTTAIPCQGLADELAGLCVQRFNLMATTSYASLDAHWKGHLKHLHDDYLESRQVCHTVPAPYTAGAWHLTCTPICRSSSMDACASHMDEHVHRQGMQIAQALCMLTAHS